MAFAAAQRRFYTYARTRHDASTLTFQAAEAGPGAGRDGRDGPVPRHRHDGNAGSRPGLLLPDRHHERRARGSALRRAALLPGPEPKLRHSASKPRRELPDGERWPDPAARAGRTHWHRDHHDVV